MHFLRFQNFQKFSVVPFSKFMGLSCFSNWNRVAQLCKKYSDFVVGIDIAGYENGHVYTTETQLRLYINYVWFMNYKW